MMHENRKKYVQGHGLDADNDRLALFSLLRSIQVVGASRVVGTRKDFHREHREDVLADKTTFNLYDLYWKYKSSPLTCTIEPPPSPHRRFWV